MVANPFPGMNPWLELRWGDIHTRLMIYAADQLQPQLPEDLRAVVEEYVALGDENGGGGGGVKRRAVKPDLRVEPSGIVAGSSGEAGGGTATLAPPLAGARVAPSLATRPVVLPLPPLEPTRRWIEIQEAQPDGRVVTVVEFLSPVNKLAGPGREAYLNKQRRLAARQVNLVEADLLRVGRRVARLADDELPDGRTDYRVDVYRASHSDQAEVYPIKLPDRLPIVAVPLRANEADVALNLQPLIDAACANGRWTAADYARPLRPPLAAADAAWAEGRLQETLQK